MLDFLNSNFNAIVALVVGIMSVLITVVKGTDWFARIQHSAEKRGLSKAWIFALDTAGELYETTVRGLKESDEFDDAAKRRVKQQAIDLLKMKLKTEGVEVAKELLPTLIEMAVNALKGSGKAASEGKLQALSLAPDLG